jgi:hypothetical protein
VALTNFFSIIPPGHTYAWYNISTCISDEGCFYMPTLLESQKLETRTVPGTLEVLLNWGTGPQRADSASEVIAYFMLVIVITDLTLASKCFPFELSNLPVGLTSVQPKGPEKA